MSTEPDFYDKVARKFGRYKTTDRHTTDYPDGNPEELFRDTLLQLSGEDVKVLDIGCADGRFTLSIAPFLKHITAIDRSSGMLTSAKKLQKKSGITNVDFEKQDAFHTPYPDEYFDMIYSRRGPSPLAEAFRLLKRGGQYAEISIGEQDCMELKLAFGRGQNYGQWNERKAVWVKKEASQIGFEIVFSNEFLYDEFYVSYRDLDLFLQGVPIFEDFDSKNDKKLLQTYASQHTTSKGIHLKRHRVVSVLRKPLLYAQDIKGAFLGIKEVVSFSSDGILYGSS